MRQEEMIPRNLTTDDHGQTRGWPGDAVGNLVIRYANMREYPDKHDAESKVRDKKDQVHNLMSKGRACMCWKSIPHRSQR